VFVAIQRRLVAITLVAITLTNLRVRCAAYLYTMTLRHTDAMADMVDDSDCKLWKTHMVRV